MDDLKLEKGHYNSDFCKKGIDALSGLCVHGADRRRYKVLVFDMGNVLVLYDPPKTMADDGLSQRQIAVMMKEVFQSPEWVAMDRGVLALEDAFAVFRQRLPLDLWGYIEEKGLKAHWMEHMPPFEEMYDLVFELKAEGYGIFLLSNASSHFYEYSKNYPVMELMDGKIISADHHCLKPEPEIYEILFESFNINPEEALFIDDMEENIRGAQRQGMDGICFSPSYSEVSKLRAILREKAIECKLK